MNIARSLIGIIFILCCWQLLVYLEQLPPYILPSPYQVAHTMVANWSILLAQTWPTAIESVAGLLLAVVIGMLSAMLFIYIPVVRNWLLPSLIISQALPTFAIAPLLVLWLGYGLASKIITIMIMLFFPVTTTFYDGLSRVEVAWLDLAQTLQANRWATLRYIVLPASLPALASGLRLAAVGAPLGAVIGEWVGASQGLGYLMLNANARLQVDMMFAALICLIILALVLFLIVDRGMQWLVLKYS